MRIEFTFNYNDLDIRLSDDLICLRRTSPDSPVNRLCEITKHYTKEGRHPKFSLDCYSGDELMFESASGHLRSLEEAFKDALSYLGYLLSELPIKLYDNRMVFTGPVSIGSPFNDREYHLAMSK